MSAPAVDPVVLQTSLAAWPGLSTERALQRALAGEGRDLVFGPMRMDHVQLVPQTLGRLTPAVLDRLQAALPGTQFRLHANVRLLERHVFADLARFDPAQEWWCALKQAHRLLGAQIYSAHPGYCNDATLAQLRSRVLRATDWLGLPVAVEGMYPQVAGRPPYLLSTWADYAWLLDSDLPYALDLSHLNIVAHHAGIEHSLVQDLLASGRCLEIHVSGNDGTADQHRPCAVGPWWASLLAQAMRSSTAVVFSEGNLRCAQVQSAPPAED